MNLLPSPETERVFREITKPDRPMVQDIRLALRGLARDRAFTAAALLSLALGIGANTAIFSVTSALLLRSLPYADAERLVILWNRSPGLNIAEDWFSTAQYFDIKSTSTTFEEVAAAIGANYNLAGDGEPERIGVIRVSSNLLPLLGARTAQGRLFLPEEDTPGRRGTAVLGHGTWARRYGQDPKVVGRTIRLNGKPYEIVGVLPEGFRLPREVLPTLGVAEDGDVFLPLPLGADAVSDRGHEDYNVVAKLKPGVSAAHAQREMDALTTRLRRDHPDVYPPNGGLTFGVVPLLEQVVGGIRPTLGLLAAAVGLVLLIACANVANLSLSRGIAREKEIAVRAAVGARPSRIVRQLLTESLLLALGGGALGVLLATFAVEWVHLVQPASVPRLGNITVDTRVLAFTVALCLGAGILFGLVPALRALRIDVYATLATAGRGSSGASALLGRGQGLRRALVVAEVGLAVVLLIGAGLLVRSFRHLQEVAPGFSPAGVLTLQLTMSGSRYEDATAVKNAYRQLFERLDALPGVSASGGVTALPLSGFFAWGPLTVEGRVPAAGENFINADIRSVAGRYFEAMKIPLLAGRLFEEGDAVDKPLAVIVDAFMAEQLWPRQDPLGKRIRFGDLKSTAPWRTVVGVVGRVKQYGLDSDGRIALYLPHGQSPARALYVVARTPADPAALAPAVKQAIQALDPDLPVYRARTMTEWVEESMARARFSMTLLSAFALLALVLAAVGIYGVMAHLVRQSTREIGIRMALGATGRSVLGLVLRQGLLIATVGTALGLLAAAALARFVESLLFGVPGVDLPTFLAVAAFLLAIALVACYVPARRAAGTDPMASLRSE